MKRNDSQTAVMMAALLLLGSLWSIHASATMVRDDSTDAFQTKPSGYKSVNGKLDSRKQDQAGRLTLVNIIRTTAWYGADMINRGQNMVDVESDGILPRFVTGKDDWREDGRHDDRPRSRSRSNNEGHEMVRFIRDRDNELLYRRDSRDDSWPSDHSGSRRFYEDQDDDHRFDFEHDGHGHHHGTWGGDGQVPGVPLPGALVMLLSSFLTLGALGRKRG